jgi:hypothetical protein
MDSTDLDQRKTWILREAPDARADRVSAWEMIETGRFMPRRIKGSFPGRELG